MSTQLALEPFTKALDRLLDETFEQVHGVYLDKGTALFETLETISAEEASQPVSTRCASIAAQVDHVRFYLALCARYARGEAVGAIDWEASWQRTSVTGEEWDALKGRLRDVYRDMRIALHDPKTWEDENAIGGAIAVVVHTAYHLGEIRQALCVVRR
ncbi:MAG: DinB family protein [Chloroflexota bacterium]|nr:DinB family protein [Chloroflexota bacterium]